MGLAVKNNYVKVIKLILSTITKVDESSIENDTNFGCCINHSELFDELSAAVVFGNEEIVYRLLKLGYDKTQNKLDLMYSKSSLFYAIHLEKFEMVRLLVEHGLGNEG